MVLLLEEDLRAESRRHGFEVKPLRERLVLRSG
jgi:hypothetical protein